MVFILSDLALGTAYNFGLDAMKPILAVIITIM